MSKEFLSYEEGIKFTQAKTDMSYLHSCCHRLQLPSESVDIAENNVSLHLSFYQPTINIFHHERITYNCLKQFEEFCL